MPRRRGQAKTSPEAIKAAQRRQAVIGYRLQGHSANWIATTTGVSLTTVHKDIIKATQSLTPMEDRALLAVQELARLDHLQAVFQPKADDGDTQAAKVILDIMDHRARICALYPQDGQPVVNLNIGKEHSAERHGINVTFHRSRFENVDIPPPPDDYVAQNLDLTRLKLVHDTVPTDAEIVPEEPPQGRALAQGDVYSASQKLPDIPEGQPRTEFDLAEWERPGRGASDGSGMKWGKR